MKKSTIHRKIRKSHRWLGVILGIQFLFWTIGGLYFSWSNMDDVHGDHHKAHVHPLSADLDFISPQIAIDSLKKIDSVNFIFEIKLVQILNQPFYQIAYSKEHDRGKKVRLADAKTGQLRAPLSEDEAKEVARRGFNSEAKITKVEYLTSTNSHHEYREQPLPAYAVSFNHPSKTTVYVAADLGTTQKFRNQNWRIFDFLWMMHTMDYKSRDNISNWVLRAFSIFGLLTIFSGFSLFFVSRKKGL